MANSDHTYALILAGGGGTRLWPKSRIKTPKQFLKLTGDQSMLQVTAQRFAKIVSWDKIIVITAKAHADLVSEQLPQVLKENIIAEPAKKDTAMAMLVGALYAKSKDPEAILVNDAADHVIVDEKEFLRLMKASVEVAADHQNLVSVGIVPSYPSSAFGYIKVGQEVKKIGKDITVFKVDNFTEKPNVATARAFISTGRYFWNANHYVWSAKALQNAFEKLMPEMYKATKDLESLGAEAFKKALPAIYEKVESISIDYAISEKADNLLLIPGDFGWDDIGEWKVMYDLGTKDLSDNVIISDDKNDHQHALLVESRKNLVHVENRLVAMIGVENMIVVDTGEILMIAPMNRSQDVKKLVERLKEESKTDYL